MDYVLRYVLPSLLGNFISGIDKNNMRTKFFSGKVSLEKVFLNPNLLKSLQIPVKIVFSDIGKLELKIPWMKRLKEPIEIYLEDVCVLLEAVESMEDYDIVSERISFLDRLTEQIMTKVKSLDESAKNKEGGSLSYYKVLILDNFQLKIKNVHIRFEDISKGFSMGITLDELSINTVDENGQPKFIDRTLEENKAKDLKKRAIIKDMCLYWNSKDKINNFISQKDYKDNVRRAFLIETVMTSEKKENGVEVILMLSLESELTFKSLKHKKNEDEPRYKVELNFKPFTMCVKSAQVSQMISLGEAMIGVLRNRKNKYTLPDLSDEDLFTITENLRGAIEDMIYESDDESFRWADELENPKKKSISEPIKKALTSLPNKLLVKLCKETILLAKKKKLLSKIEKKTQSRSFLSKLYWKDRNSTEEEMSKVEAYFDAFNAEDTDNLDLLTKGFIFQLRLHMNEVNLVLIHQTSQKGISATFSDIDIVIDRLNENISEITNFSGGVRAASLFYTQLKEGNQLIKKIPVMKTNPGKQLAFLDFKRKLMEKSETREINCLVSETEFQFIPEFLIVLKKMFIFRQSSSAEGAFANMAYEKIADMKKNAEDQITNLMEYNSTLIVCINIDSVNLIIPLTPVLGLESDCWVLSVKNVAIATKPMANEEIQEFDINQFTQVFDNVNFKYYTTINLYHACKLDPTRVPKPEHLFTLLEDMRIFVETQFVEDSTYLPKDIPQKKIGIEFDLIKINMTKDVFRKVQALKSCFDFSSEKEFHDYLETEKKLIMANSDGLFKVFHKKNFEIGENWSPHILVSSGFYLYFYENALETKSKMHIYIKKAKVIVDKKDYDMPYVIRIKSRYGNTIIGMEREDDVNRLTRLIEAKNSQFFNSATNLDLDGLDHSSKFTRKSELDMDKIDHQIIRVNLKFKKTIFNFIDERFNVVNEAKIENLLIDVTQRALDQNINLSLKGVYLKDFKAIKKDQTSILLVSSQSESREKFVQFKLTILDERHPEFIKNTTKKTFNLFLNTLDINWIPERFFYVSTFFNDSEADSMGLEGSYRLRRQSFSMPRKNAIKKEEIETKEENNKMLPGEKNFILLKGDIKINNFTFKLTSRKTYLVLALVSVDTFLMSIEKDKMRSIYKGGVQNLKAFEMTGYNQPYKFEKSTPQELLSVGKGDSKLEFSFEGRQPHYVKSLGTNVYNVLKITGNSIKIKYVQQPVIRVINYIMNFIMSFDFGFNKDDATKEKEAKETVKREGFTSFELKITNPKIIVQSKPSSEVQFELDMDEITVKNRITKGSKRIKQEILGVESLYSDEYLIKTSDITFSKVVETKERFVIANLFQLDMTFERCLWFEELILVHDIEQEEKYDFIENSFFIKGNITPVLLKVNQEDYLDVMDCIFLNIINDDNLEDFFHLNDELTPELEKINRPTPINLVLKLDYFSTLIIDQVDNFNLLAKLTALINEIEFLRDRKYDKKVNISIGNISGEFFDFGIGGLKEKSLFGREFDERDFPYAKDTSKLILEHIAENDSSKIEIQREKMKGRMNKSHFKIEIDMKANLNKDFVFHIEDLKIFLIIGVIMRLKDVFMLYGQKEQDEREANSSAYKTMKTFKVILENAEITLPGLTDTNIIVKGKILFSFDSYDIVDLLDKNNEELLSSKLRISLEQNEVYVFQSKQKGNHVSYIKRSIVLPFSFQYTTIETVFFEKTRAVYLSKRDSKSIIGPVLIRASALDSITVASAIKTLLDDMRYYWKLPKFPESSRYTVNIIENPVPTINVRFLYEKITLIYEGLQFKSINDFSGLSIPFLDFSLYSDQHSELKFEKSVDFIQGKIKLYFSSNYFNSRASMWEPIIETWPFILDIDISRTGELHRRIDIISDKDLNLNFSDEQVQMLLTAYYDWMTRFQDISVTTIGPVEELNPKDIDNEEISRRSSRTMTSLDAGLEKKTNEVEYISPYTIWNDTGYVIRVKPIIRDREEIKITLTLESGDEKDLLMESSIHKIFESSSNQNVLNSNKTNVEIAFPGETICLNDIDVHNIGSKSFVLTLNSKTFPIVCSVYNYKTKKLVRFSSTVVIKNLLNISFFVKIHTQIKKEIDNPETEELIMTNKFEEMEDEENFMEILPNTSKSLPVDKLEYKISFFTDICDNRSDIARYNPLNMECYDQAEIVLGENTYAILRVEEFRGYHIVYVEPPIVLKNCLPIQVEMEIRKDNTGDELTMTPQENLQILNYSSDKKLELIMRVPSKGLKSNKYLLQPYTPNSDKTFYLEKGEKQVNLDIFISSQLKSYTRNLIFYAKVCIINETTEKLVFYSEDKENNIITGHEIVIDGLYCYIFNDVPFLRIKTESESAPSDQIILNRFDSINLDLEDNPAKAYNFVVKVSQELVDRNYNLFTTVVSVTPRFVFLNNTKRPIQTYFEVPGMMSVKTIPAQERLPIHFTKREDNKKLIKIILVDIHEDDQKGERWEKSGLIDCSSPGDIQFMCQTECKSNRKFFNLNITLQKNFMLLNLEEQEGKDASIQLHNRTSSLTLEIEQKGVKYTRFQVLPNHKVPFSWIEPLETKEIIVKVIQFENPIHQFSIEIDKIGEVINTELPHEEHDKGLYYIITLEGSSRVIKFLDYHFERRQTSSSISEKVDLFRAKIPAFGISLISAAGEKKVELLYIKFSPIQFLLEKKEKFTSMHLRIKSLKIDNNCVEDQIYPLMVFPENTAKLDRGMYPFLDFILKINNRAKPTDILYIKDLGIYLDETNFYLDGQSLNAIAEFIRSINKILTKTVRKVKTVQQYIFLSFDQQREVKKNNYNYIHWRIVKPIQASSEFVYIEKLLIQPVIFNLSFKHIQFNSGSSFIFNFIKKSLGKALANFDRAPLKLTGIELYGTYGTKSNVFGTMLQRYKEVTIDTVMGVFLSSNILGNPGKFFNSISSGFNDLFDIPAREFQKGPLDGMVGIVKGTGTFLGKTIGATFDSVHNITDALASGMVALSGDTDYMVQRERNNQQKNKNILYGTYQAASAVASGFYFGFSGLIELPVQHGMKEGVKGFFRGLWKGLRGVVFKPPTGIIDGVSKFTEGIANNLVAEPGSSTSKSRPPRVFYGRQRIYKAYNLEEAAIFNEICKIKPKKYRNFTLMDCVFWKEVNKDPKKTSEGQKKKDDYFCFVIMLEELILFNTVTKKIIWRVKTVNYISHEQSQKVITIKEQHRKSKIIPTMKISDLQQREDIMYKLDLLKDIVKQTKA